MKRKNKFKYTTIVGAQILPSKVKTVVPEITEAKASKLKRLTPYLNEKDHSDLFGAAFEIALVNQFNENGDGIATEDCSQLLNGFSMKQLNLEHDRSMIVGHILYASFCERAFGKELYYEDIYGTREVFSVVLSSVIYKLANEQLSNILSDMASKDYDEDENSEKIYASWEIGFNEYDIAIGGRLLSECEIISDPDKKEHYKKFLKSEGASGRLSDGKYVQRLIRGEILPLGGGLTMNPAAKVKGIYVVDPVIGEINHMDDDEEDEDAILTAKENNKKIRDEISQSTKDNVTTVETDIFDSKKSKKGKEKMNEEQVKKLIEEAFASKTKKESEKQEAIASVTDRILEAIKENNDVYVAEKEALAKEKEQAEARIQEQETKINELQASVESFKADLQKASNELNEMKEEREKLEAQATFDSRMDEIKSVYVLDEKLVEIVAKRLAGVETDEQFEELKSEFEISFSHLTKEAIEKKQEEAKASLEEKNNDEIIEKGGKEENTSVANNSQEGSKEETLQEKFKRVFNKESVEIK